MVTHLWLHRFWQEIPLCISWLCCLLFCYLGNCVTILQIKGFSCTLSMLAQISLCLLRYTGQSTETRGTSWHRQQLFPASYQTGVRLSGGATRYFLAHQPRQITVQTQTHTHNHQHTQTFRINTANGWLIKVIVWRPYIQHNCPLVTPPADTLCLFRVQFHCHRHSHTHKHHAINWPADTFTAVLLLFRQHSITDG